jgi:hypothetical protein
MQLLKHVFKEEIRNFIFNLLFEKASCKFRNYFRMYRKYCKKVFISGDLVPLTTPGKSSNLPIYRFTLYSLLNNKDRRLLKMFLFSLRPLFETQDLLQRERPHLFNIWKNRTIVEPVDR